MDLTRLFKPYFEKDGGSGGAEDDQTDNSAGGDNVDEAGKKKTKVEFSADQQKEIDRIIGDARIKEREKAKAEAEAKVKQEQAAAEKKALEDQGKHKELAEAAEKKALAEKERADRAEEEAKVLRLQRDFENKVRDAKLEFKNSLAAKDAFKAVVELLGDETEITDDHIKQLVKDRDFLFGKADPVNLNNDAGKKGKGNTNILTQEQIEKKKRSISPL